MFKNANDQYKKYPTNQTHSMEIDRLKQSKLVRRIGWTIIEIYNLDLIAEIEYQNKEVIEL